MGKTERQGMKYSDYYCIMSLAEFTAWQEDGDSEPFVTYQVGAAG